MRILQVVTYYDENGAYGGPTRVALNQCKELIRRGHQVAIAAATDRKVVETKVVDGVQVVCFPSRRLLGSRSSFASIYSLALGRWIKKNSSAFDLIHCHFGRDLVGAYAVYQARQLRIPLVIQTHGMVAADRRLSVRTFDKLVTRPASRRRTIFALTESERQMLHALLGSDRDVRILRNGLEVSSEIGTVPTSQVEVLYCARLAPRKRPEIFLEVARRIHPRHPKVRFTLLGPDDGLLAQLERKIEASGLENVVRYEGALPYDAVIERMATASVYVLPSFNEPFPMSVLEAMSAGVACVIGYDTGFSTELKNLNAALVTDGSASGFCEAVDRLLEDENLRREIASNGKKAAESFFSIRSVVDELEAAYREAAILPACSEDQRDDR